MKLPNRYQQNRILEYTLVIFFFIMLTIVLTFPLIFELNSAYVMNKKDYYFNLWNFWWFKKAIFQNHALDFRTEHIFYPEGTTLAFHSTNIYNYVLSVPLQNFFSVLTSYNILYLSTFILSGTGCYLLIKYLTNNKFGALIGSIVFTFSPFHFEEYSRINVASIQWLPFCALYFIKMKNHKKIIDACLAGLFLALVAFSFWEYFIFAIFFIIIFMIVFYRDTFNTKFLQLFLVMIAMACICIFKFIGPLLSELRSDGFYLYEPISAHSELFGIMVSRAFGFFTWPAVLGYTALALCAYCCLMVRSKDMYAWIVVLGFFFLFTLGPHPSLFGKNIADFPLPFAALKKIPFIQILRTPHRFLAMVTLAMAVLSGFAAADISHKRRGSFILVVLTMLMIFEYAAIPKQSFSSITIPSIYERIATEEGEMAVVDVPLNDFGGAYSMYYQTFHSKNIVGGYVARLPKHSKNFIENNKVLRLLAKPNSLEDINLTEEEKHIALEALKKIKIRYVIVHLDFLMKSKRNRSRFSRKKALLFSFLPYSLNSTNLTKWRSLPEGMDFSEVFADESRYEHFLEYLNILFAQPVYADKFTIVYKIF